MSIVSLQFFVFLAAVFGAYWLCPSRARWVVLLAASACFMYLCAGRSLFLCAVFAAQALLAWLAALGISRGGSERRKSLLAGVTVAALLAVLIAYKDLAFFVNNLNTAGALLGADLGLRLPGWAAPFGISYYTLILVGYVLDVRWGTVEAPQRNPLKLLLFAGYFPQLTSGPFTRFGDMGSLVDGQARWDLRRTQFGLQRLVWGLFKKLVVAERLAVVVATIYDSAPVPLAEDPYVGLMVAVGAVAYVGQLYTDFSGCVDIVIGASQLFGIPLAENFQRPFSAVTLSELWRRWHMTLGFWLKDYVLYPALKSRWMGAVRRLCKKRWGKRAARDVPTYIGMLITWFCVGFWHGGTWKYIFSSGLIFFVMIAGGMLLEPVFQKLAGALRIDAGAWSWTFFRRLRTFCLFSFPVSLGRRGSLMEGLRAWKTVFTHWNPWVLVDGSLFQLGLDRADLDVCILGLVVILVVSLLQVRHGSVRELIARQNLVFRWCVYLALFFAVLILGCYGPGYDPADFIYGDF